MGYIKDYDGGTLMECIVNSSVNYLNVPSMLKAQRERLWSSLTSVSRAGRIQPGLTQFVTPPKGSPATFSVDSLPPGTLEAGWSMEELCGDISGKVNGGAGALKESLQRLTSSLVATDDLHFFREPVDLAAVPDYITICPTPIGSLHFLVDTPPAPAIFNAINPP